MKIVMLQMNPIIGDIKRNTQRIIQAIYNAIDEQADLILTPELALTGYPPEDFLLLPDFMEAVEASLSELIDASRGIIVIAGLPRYNPYQKEKILYNSAAIIQNQTLLGFYDKILLPTYDVFDERRYFEPGEHVSTWNLNGKKIAITICEDMWQHSGLLHSTRYQRDPVQELKDQHPDFFLNLSASPYSVDKFHARVKVCHYAAQTLQCPVFWCNQVGGNDSLIFDGYSLYVGPQGLLQYAKGFKEEEVLIDTDEELSVCKAPSSPLSDLYQALVLGVRDYFKKLGFNKACLGLSGGIDSALVACIAVDALGSENVLAIAMPSRYSSSESLRDAKILAERLNIECKVISIEEPFTSYLGVLSPFFEGMRSGLAEENLQARVRGMLLMAFSNKFGYIVLSTGNKSELALGYSTLYGDMCGGLAVIGDLTKGQVYALSRWINRKEEVIPAYVIERPPSAELRPDQKDSDSLPEYEIVDNVLQAYVENHLSAKQIAERFDYTLEVVQDMVKRIHQNEYKRRQAALCLRVSEKAFSVGRKFPIVQGWVS